MSRLTPEEKLRIRREEEARMRAIDEEARLRALEEERFREQVRRELEEERYRAEVRAELEAGATGTKGHLAEPIAGEGERPLLVPEGEQFVWGAESREPKRRSPSPGTPRAAQGPGPTASAPPTSGTSPMRQPAKPRPGLWWIVASLLLVAGIAVVVIALVQGGGSAQAALDLTLRAGGPIAELAVPDWRPEDLATGEYAILPDGSVGSRPGRGLATFADWRAAAEAPPPVMNNPFPENLSLPELQERYRLSPPDPAMPRLRLLGGAADKPGAGLPLTPAAEDRHAPAVDASIARLLAAVPADAWLVVGLNKARIAGSATLSRLHAQITRAMGGTSPLAEIGGGASLFEAPELVFAAMLDGDRPDRAFVVAGRSAQPERMRELAIAAGAQPADGKDGWLTLPEGHALLLEVDRFAAARRSVAGAMRSAISTGGALSAGELAPALRDVAGKTALFAVMRVLPAQAAELDGLLGGLGRAQSLSAAVAVDGGLAGRLRIVFPDIVLATNVLAAFESRRYGLAGLPEGAMLTRVRAAIAGPELTLTLDLSEAELAALFTGVELGE